LEKIYILDAVSGVEDYIELKGDLESMKDPYLLDQLQHLKHDPVTFGLTDEGGLDVPDAMMQDGMLFVSNRLKKAFLDYGQEQLYFKQINVVDQHFGIKETMWLTVVPRIDCLRLHKCEFEETQWEVEDGVIPFWRPRKLSINPAMAGWYQVFRLQGVEDNRIYIRESLCRKLEAEGFEGLKFFEFPQI